MTVSKSTLKRVKTPIQRKRLLSVAAAISDEEHERAGRRAVTEGWMEEEEERGRGEEREDDDDGDDGENRARLDSETGQTILSKESGTT